jgi:hypothetical protein
VILGGTAQFQEEAEDLAVLDQYLCTVVGGEEVAAELETSLGGLALVFKAVAKKVDQVFAELGRYLVLFVGAHVDQQNE